MVQLRFQKLTFLGWAFVLPLLEPEARGAASLFLRRDLLIWFRVKAHAIEVLFFCFVVFDQRDHVDEIRVVCVNVAQFNFYQVANHLFGLAE